MTVATNPMPMLVRKPLPHSIVEVPNLQTTPSGADADARRLAAAVARGDEAAFRQLYDHYSN